MARNNAAAVEADDLEAGGGEQEASLRETIEDARDEVIDRQTEAAGGEDAGGGPGRDASGRFTRREPEAGDDGKPKQPSVAARQPEPAAAAPSDDQRAARAPAAGAAPSAQPQGAPGANQSPPSAGAADLRVAPQGWSPAGKALWAGLPEAARAEIARREADMHRALTSQDQERQFGRSFAEIANQHQAVIQRTGATAQALWSEFLGRAQILQGGDVNAKAAMLREIAQRHGIDARTLLGIPPAAAGGAPNPRPGANGAGAPAGFAPLPPALQTMQQEWQEMKRQMAERQREEDRQTAERRQREEQTVNEEIVAFRSKPEIRFFDEVQPHMVALLNGGVASNLEEAYNQAIWARPDLRAIIQKEEADRQQSDRDKQERARRARLKGGSVRGGAGSTPASTPGERSLREELQAGFAEARSRV